MKKIGLLQAVKLAFVHYADFSGRATRREYWWFTAFNCIMLGLFSNVLPSLFIIWMLATLIPSLSVSVRRLHDVGKYGRFYFWYLLPVPGWILLLIQFCKAPTEDNQWGPKC